MQVTRWVDAKYAGKSDLSQLCWKAQPGVGEIDASVGSAHHVIGLIEPFTLPALGNGRDRAMFVYAGNAPVIGAFAHDETAVAIESTPITLSGILPHYRYRPVRVPTQKPVPL